MIYPYADAEQAESQMSLDLGREAWARETNVRNHIPRDSTW